MEGVILTPLKKIYHPKGDIYYGMKKTDAGFAGFGEAYFSTVKSGQIKGWNRHKRMTLNLIVPIGTVKFVVKSDRNKKLNNNLLEVELSLNNYKRLTIPPGLWVGFQCTCEYDSLILNIADMEHDPNEIDYLDLEQINYNW
ncbi:MAG: dTDP-4-dehydrorhamnose 3,5-epimerase [Candidatus Marinimicrobia bacterium]|nr:dTDP-4-dehydrorhamnose 3,5-epimerase [Candidatus Neomarinimicrobiota bacterium]MBT4783950.1 dTDP-4-dehydrorhamnose 3,5-epimerase [Candidatus Neomarinimicrobiota bacterium]MBT5759427.1 dTDP-4-dehydrorhamnose 3,5-epimerase [Candidatus Neomarinimicrobiota bacterium]MBT6982502.1 dTDP-4-dehydrorhamnose 3,5-epimerase [Candidatus Neomarinimicrobiota bacterium]MBT7520568.1 dTDP-4-dehydrorhamnose 3,5-epimerase [Candidatus Neomarinimicrobiota bacterium]